MLPVLCSADVAVFAAAVQVQLMYGQETGIEEIMMPTAAAHKNVYVDSACLSDRSYKSIWFYQ